MLKKRFSDIAKRYNSCLRGYCNLTSDTPLRINQLRLKIGDVITFMIDESLYEGSITSFEVPLYNEELGEVDSVCVDYEEFSITEMDWVGIE